MPTVARNPLKDVYRIVFQGLYGEVTKTVQAWSESDAIACVVSKNLVYKIIDIKRVA